MDTHVRAFNPRDHARRACVEESVPASQMRIPPDLHAHV